MQDPESTVKKGNGGKFFAVDARVWPMVCDMGLTVAVSYLTIACGTGADNRTSLWSKKAIHAYTGITTVKAQRVIDLLEERRLLAKHPSSTKNNPRYCLTAAHEVPGCSAAPPAPLTGEALHVHRALGRGKWVRVPKKVESRDRVGFETWMTVRPRDQAEALVKTGHAEMHSNGEHFRAVIYDPESATKPKWIWLPNEIVMGAAKEEPPLRRILKAQDIRVLRLFIEMYDGHFTNENGGIDPCVLRLCYEGKKLAACGPFIVWTFRRTQLLAWRTGAAFVKQFFTPDDEPKMDDAKSEWSFWACLQLLRDLGLVRLVPHLFAGDPRKDGILEYPLAYDATGTDAENELAKAARDAAEGMLFEGHQARLEQGAQHAVAPVLAHIADVQLVGVFRMRYLPKTSTNARFIERNDEWRALTERFKTLGKRNEANTSRDIKSSQ